MAKAAVRPHLHVLVACPPKVESLLGRICYLIAAKNNAQTAIPAISGHYWVNLQKLMMPATI
jgi:hypothetical protein